MKKITVLFSMLLVMLMVGQGLALADGAADAAAGKTKKVCKTNFKPGNKKHTDAPAAK